MFHLQRRGSGNQHRFDEAFTAQMDVCSVCAFTLVRSKERFRNSAALHSQLSRPPPKTNDLDAADQVENWLTLLSRRRFFFFHGGSPCNALPDRDGRRSQAEEVSGHDPKAIRHEKLSTAECPD